MQQLIFICYNYLCLFNILLEILNIFISLLNPHLVIKGDTEYLGVTFIDGEEVVFDKEIIASALPLYDGVDYSGLTEGTKFMIMEGRNIVGEGIVNEVFQHISSKEFKKL